MASPEQLGLGRFWLFSSTVRCPQLVSAHAMPNGPGLVHEPAVLISCSPALESELLPEGPSHLHSFHSPSLAPTRDNHCGAWHLACLLWLLGRENAMFLSGSSFLQTHDICCLGTCQVPATQQMFVGESRTDEQHPAQEESGLYVKAHQLHLAYKDSSSPNISKLHPVPLVPRGAPAGEAGCEAAPCDGGCQGCSSRRGQGCPHPPRAGPAPRAPLQPVLCKIGSNHIHSPRQLFV